MHYEDEIVSWSGFQKIASVPSTKEINKDFILVQPEEIKIELSGQLDTRTQYYDYLRKMFSNIHFETVAPEKLMKELQENYPAHYLSTYFNLA